MQIIIRGFAYEQGPTNRGARVQRFEERQDINALDLDTVLPQLAEKHAAALVKDDLHMIEIEFPDEPDPAHRFFRFGTSPWGMVGPVVAIDLTKGIRDDR